MLVFYLLGCLFVFGTNIYLSLKFKNKTQHQKKKCSKVHFFFPATIARLLRDQKEDKKKDKKSGLQESIFSFFDFIELFLLSWF